MKTWIDYFNADTNAVVLVRLISYSLTCECRGSTPVVLLVYMYFIYTSTDILYFVYKYICDCLVQWLELQASNLGLRSVMSLVAFISVAIKLGA